MPDDGKFLGTYEPPAALKAVAWLINTVGVNTAILCVLVGVMIGWIPSPLNKIEAMSIDQHVHNQEMSTALEKVVKGMANQRCMQAVASIAISADVIATAAMSDTPCASLEWLRNNNNKGVK